VIDVEDLRSFVEVVESGGFNRAARRLGISKSMVSRRIARMEAELGARLLSRTTRGISPTEAGLEYKARSERILAELEEARETVARQGGGAVGRLRLAAPLSFGVRYLVPLLGELAERHPRLEIDVAFSDHVVDLIGERFDAAVRIGTLRDSTLVARRLAPVTGVLVASPAYLARRGRPGTPSELAQHECLIYTGGTSPDWTFRAGTRTVSIRPQGRLRSDNGEALRQWAAAGLGILAAPSFTVADAVDAGTLEPLLLDYPLPEAAVHVVRPPGAHVPGKVRVLIDALVEGFAGAPEWERCLAARERGRKP